MQTFRSVLTRKLRDLSALKILCRMMEDGCIYYLFIFERFSTYRVHHYRITIAVPHYIRSVKKTANEKPINLCCSRNKSDRKLKASFKVRSEVWE